jgi:RNA polymerase sigma-70 factor (ECF subfamily)
MIAAAMADPSTADRPDAAAAGLRFDAVYREHVGFVWRSLRRLGVAEAEIEDAAHEVFLVVHRRLAEFAGASALTTWLYGIARGVASNRRRGEVRRLRRHAEAPVPELSEGPVEQVARSQAAAAVERFLAGLPEDQRVVFELFEIEGLRAHEIAGALAVNINTIYTRLRAARQRFAAFVAALQEEGGGSHGRG